MMMSTDSLGFEVAAGTHAKARDEDGEFLFIVCL